MKTYIKTTSNQNNELSLLDITNIDAIVYVEDIKELDSFNSSELTTPYDVNAAKKVEYDYSQWTREQLLQLKQEHLNEFDRIRDKYVLLKVLNHEDLTPNQLRYVEDIKTISRNVDLKEVKHTLKLIKDCHDFYRVPSDKNRQFLRYLKTHGINLTQIDVENIMHSLHIKDFSEGRYSTDKKYWGHGLMIFEFNDSNFKFSCGKSLPKNELPFKVYIKVDNDLTSGESIAIVSFHKPEYDMQHPIDYPVEKENPETW